MIGQRHYDVQLMGGAALHFGWVAEMKTGEGKTLVSTLPAYLNGLAGRGMHIITVNDYLARRDAEWMGQIHRWLGLERRPHHPRRLRPASTSARSTRATSPTARTTSSASTTSATTWRCRWSGKVQRGHVYAIVDEVDSILIDEARTPLIISGRVADAAKLYYQFASDRPRACSRDERLRGRRREAHGRADSKTGIEKVEQALGVDNLYDGVSQNLVHQLQRGAQGQGALQARQGLHHPARRGEDRRRVHRPHPRGPALVRGSAPGGRGQRGREDQRGEPDPRHHHAAELLPHVREARRHDRHGADRGVRAREHLQPAGRADPDEPPDGARRPAPT